MQNETARPGHLSASWPGLVVLTLVRLVLNLQARIVYPFLPVISRGLSVPLETASLLLTARSLVGATSPLYGYLSDRYGRRALMLGGVAALGLGATLIGIAPSFGLVLVAFVLLGLSKASYDPALQAFIGDTVSYDRRGRVLGAQELSWAGAWLIGVPASGFLIARYGWRSPFVAIALLGALSLLAVWWVCPANRGQGGVRPPAPFVLRKESLHWITRSAVLALVVNALLVLANENVFIVYGAWLESRFGLAITALGLASIVISLAELAAEGTSAGLVDWIGKRRAVLGGIGLNVIAYLLLPAISGSFGGALASVVLMALTFEFSIVSALSIVSELAPQARGTVMALNVAFISGGRVIGSLVGPRLWELGGMPLNAVCSAGIMVVAGLVLLLGVKERDATELEKEADLLELPAASRRH